MGKKLPKKKSGNVTPKKYPRVVASTKGSKAGGSGGHRGQHSINRGTGYVDQDSYYVDSWLDRKRKESATVPWGDRLIAGPFVGELGWELFGWQGRIRYLSQFFKRTIVICRKGFSCLYEDFADAVEECDEDLSGETSGPLLRHFKYRNEIAYHQVNDLRILPQTHMVGYNWRARRQSSSFNNQFFVEYGTGPGKHGDWDVLFHARSTTKSWSDYRNWPTESWSKLSKFLSQFNVASIGAKDGADHVPGTTDLRGIPLAETVDVMRGAGVVVGPSSGPIHLAALCKCQQITWFGLPSTVTAARRYNDWNPFHVLNVAMYEVEWNPDPRQVAFEVRAVLKK